MPTPTRSNVSRQPSRRRLLLAALLLPGLVHCITVSGQSGEPIRTYLLDIDRTAPVALNPSGPVLMISTIATAMGVGSRQILYVEREYELREFRRSQWADRPDRMLEPILFHALESSGQFEAVVGVAYGSFADLRLDVELIQLQQEFFEEPSQARVQMRVQIIDLVTQKVVGTRFIEEVEPAPSDDSYGGVTAMNRALERAIDQIVAFCVEAARRRASVPPPASDQSPDL